MLRNVRKFLPRRRPHMTQSGHWHCSRLFQPGNFARYDFILSLGVAMRRHKSVKLISSTVASWPLLVFAVPALWLLTVRLLADEHGTIPVMVADFDYHDTSGEVADQRLEHAACVKAFAGMLRERLAEEDKYKILQLDCGKVTCSAASIGGTIWSRRR